MRQDKNHDIVVNHILENQDKFYRLAYSYVRNESDALDIVQNAICKALEKYETIQNIEFVSTWFYRILVNESINYIHKNRREILNEKGFLEEPSYLESEFEEKEDLFEEINSLPLDTQNIIKLRFYEELSLQEIADITKENINTVKTKLYRGLKILKEEVVYE